MIEIHGTNQLSIDINFKLQTFKGCCCIQMALNVQVATREQLQQTLFAMNAEAEANHEFVKEGGHQRQEI